MPKIWQKKLKSSPPGKLNSNYFCSYCKKYNIYCVKNYVNNLSFKNVFTGFYQNVRGLRTKIRSSKCNIPLMNVDYFILTETWQNTDIVDSELGFDDYNVFRFDRSVSTSSGVHKGGVAICIHKRYSAKQVQTSISNAEKLSL